MRIVAILRFVLAIGLVPATSAAQTPVSVFPVPATVPVAAISFAPRPGDVKGNVEKMQSLARDAIGDGARIIVFPELATSGYSVETWPAPQAPVIAQPFSELSSLVDLAKRHAALIVVGIAERDGANLYNSAVVIEPSGRTSVQRKRWSFTGAWHRPGNTPIEVYRTPWGNVAVAICADTFHMESSRIAALKGADILLVPANWWGAFGQLGLWQTRARENGIWLVVANRLGREPMAGQPPGAMQDMRGPSAVISPSGHVVHVHDPSLHVDEPDKVVLQQWIDLGARREPVTPVLRTRIDQARDGLASANYRPPHFAPPKGLPPTGSVPVHALAYEPAPDASENLETLKHELAAGEIPRGALVVLPGLGLSTEAVAAGRDAGASPYWRQVASVVRQSGVQAVVTSVPVREDGRMSQAVAYVTAAGMTVAGQTVRGSAPLVVDHPFGRVGIVTGDDALLPEVPAHLARSGVDLFIVVSTNGSGKHRQLLGAGARTDAAGPSFDELARHWVWATVNCVHVVANDASGQAVAATAERGCDLVRETRFFRHTARSFVFDTEPVRRKVLPVLLPEERDLFLQTATAAQR